MSDLRVGWVVACLALALVGYHVPWYTHETAGFTMHAYDLAEWTSLHPAVRSSSPPMLTSFLLRAPLWAMITALALAANWPHDARWRWVLRGLAALLALRFVPPTDFFTGGASNDPNYRQMALLTGLSVGAIGLAFLLYRVARLWQETALAVALLAGMLAGWVGLSRAGELLDNFEIEVAVGPGLVSMTLAAGFAILVMVWGRLRRLSRYARWRPHAVRQRA